MPSGAFSAGIENRGRPRFSIAPPQCLYQLRLGIVSYAAGAKAPLRVREKNNIAPIAQGYLHRLVASCNMGSSRHQTGAKGQ